MAKLYGKFFTRSAGSLTACYRIIRQLPIKCNHRPTLKDRQTAPKVYGLYRGSE